MPLPSFSNLTFIVEAVDPVNTGTLVVASEQKEVLGILNFVGQQQANGLQRLLASVHIVAQEKIVSLWRETPVLKQPQEVIVLAMDISCKNNRDKRTSTISRVVLKQTSEQP